MVMVVVVIGGGSGGGFWATYFTCYQELFSSESNEIYQ